MGTSTFYKRCKTLQLNPKTVDQVTLDLAHNAKFCYELLKNFEEFGFVGEKGVREAMNNLAQPKQHNMVKPSEYAWDESTWAEAFGLSVGLHVAVCKQPKQPSSVEL